MYDQHNPCKEQKVGYQWWCRIWQSYPSSRWSSRWGRSFDRWRLRRWGGLRWLRRGEWVHRRCMGFDRECYCCWYWDLSRRHLSIGCVRQWLRMSRIWYWSLRGRRRTSWSRWSWWRWLIRSSFGWWGWWRLGCWGRGISGHPCWWSRYHWCRLWRRGSRWVQRQRWCWCRR